MVSSLSLGTIKTYRYLRLAIVAAVMLLFTALVIQIIRDEGVLGSISAYYYTPARNVFVGAILAGSLGLIAVRGRPGAENVLLNLSGTLLPVVALVPTPIAPDTTRGVIPAFSCDKPLTRCVPPESLPDVEVGVSTLLVAGLVILAFSFWTLRRNEHAGRADHLGFWGAVAAWLATGLLFGPGPDWSGRILFLRLGHYTAAVIAFGLLVAIGFINGVRSQQVLSLQGLEVHYASAYRMIAIAMSTVLVVGLFAAGFVVRPNSENPLVFVIEALLLFLFTVFWTFQTREFWHEGLPQAAIEGSADPRT